MPVLQQAWDLIPRTTIGRHGRSPYAVAAAYGAAVAMVAGLVLGAVTGVPALTVLAMGGAASAGVAGASGLRRLLTGRHEQVALEQLAGGLVLTAALLALTGQPVLAGLDVAAVCCALAQAVGRLGCAASGCCFGRPARAGIVYPAGHAALGVPSVVLGVPTVPVALIEAVGLAGVGAVSAVCAVAGRAGAGLIAYLLLAGPLRAVAEGWRGDPRPELRGVSLPRLMAGAEVLLGLGLALWLPGRPAAQPAVLACVAISGGLIAVVTARLLIGDARPLRPRDIREAIAAVRDLVPAAGDEPQAARLSSGLAVVVSREQIDVHLSYSYPGAPPGVLAECAARTMGGLLVVDARISAAGILHVLARSGPPRPRPVGWRRLELDVALARPAPVRDPGYFTAGRR
ncbi:prolipoprotein diacylglyceryl transferase family protein [Actinoplanes sp. M2I2]|uniref:prolipoprotein diacylglyceryl transferase family protein n=1 Tax=Actinoplanes sp. M2I2 TaxID=1734444 RepID=UPI002020E9E6|nr:prolipoprotein diacylglyceryl transferase family protein [Actinoplanes sp. M2I2]